MCSCRSVAIVVTWKLGFLDLLEENEFAHSENLERLLSLERSVVDCEGESEGRTGGHVGKSARMQIETRLNDSLTNSESVRAPLSKISLRAVVSVWISMSRDCRRPRSLLTTRLNLESDVPVGWLPASPRANPREREGQRAARESRRGKGQDNCRMRNRGWKWDAGHAEWRRSGFVTCELCVLFEKFESHSVPQSVLFDINLNYPALLGLSQSVKGTKSRGGDGVSKSYGSLYFSRFPRE